MDVRKPVEGFDAARLGEIFDRFSSGSEVAPTTSVNSYTLPPALAGRIAVKRTPKGAMLDIDDRAFYLGFIGDVIDCSIKYYQCYTYAENGFPEAFEHIPEELYMEIRVVYLCMKKALIELNVTSYDDLFFFLTFQSGIAIIVSIFFVKRSICSTEAL